MCVLKPGAAATASVLTSAANMAATVRGRGETRMRAVLKDRRPATRADRRLREERVLRPPDFKVQRTPPARYEAGRLTRAPLSYGVGGNWCYTSAVTRSLATVASLEPVATVATPTCATSSTRLVTMLVRRPASRSAVLTSRSTA